jgi:hypothetical protein
MNPLSIISLVFFLWYVTMLMVQQWKKLPKSISASVKIYGWQKFLLFGWGVGVPMLCYEAMGYITDPLEQVILAGMGISLMVLSITVNVEWDRPTKILHFVFSGLLFCLGYLFVYLHFGDYKTVCVFVLAIIGMAIGEKKQILLWTEVVGSLPLLFYWMLRI